MPNNKKKTGQVESKNLQAFCDDLADAYEKTQKDLEWLEEELAKDVEADFKKAEEVLDLCEDRLWAIEAKKYGIDVEDFKNDASLYRRGFSKEDIIGLRRVGIKNFVSTIIINSADYHIEKIFQLFVPEYVLNSVNIWRIIVDNLNPEQLSLLRKMTYPVILMTPAGSFGGKIDVLNRYKVKEQGDVFLPGPNNDLIDYTKVKNQPRNMLSIIELYEKNMMLDLTGNTYNKFYSDLADNEPDSLAEQYKYYQEKYRQFGAEIIDVHEYLVLMEMSLYRSAQKASRSGPFSYVIDKVQEQNNSIFNLQDFPDDTKGIGFGRFDLNKSSKKWQVVLNAADPNQSYKGVQFRPSIKICEF